MIMHKIATVNARIEPRLKIQAESILFRVGLTSAEAIRLFYRQICLNKGLPFNVKIPNKKTVAAIEEAKVGKTHKAKSVAELFEGLE
jgi:DNA-damage-inducible protein J